MVTDFKPKVSIVIPVYNVEKYLMRCMDSVRKQTYTNLEIILIDDGSKDCSGVICDELVAQDKRIRVVHKKRGQLMFVDSDDWLDLNTVEVRVNLFTKYPETQCVLFPYVREFGDRQGAIDFFVSKPRIFDAEEVRLKMSSRCSTSFQMPTSSCSLTFYPKTSAVSSRIKRPIRASSRSFTVPRSTTAAICPSCRLLSNSSTSPTTTSSSRAPTASPRAS